MWIAAGDPARAAAALDKALSGTGLVAEHRGEALLDRARAAEAAGDLKTARAKVNEAMGTISRDPFAWYFSAALALREGNPKEAERMIGEALALAPADPMILFEAGHVAEANDDVPGARMYWERAIERDPKGRIGRDAREAAQGFGIPVLDAEIHQRIALAEAIIAGQTVFEYAPASPAAEEFNRLSAELRAILLADRDTETLATVGSENHE